MVSLARSLPRRLLVGSAALCAGLFLASCTAAPPEAASTGSAARLPHLEQPTAEPAGEPTQEPAENPAEDSAAEQDRQASDPLAFDCAALGELACLESSDCTLRQNEDKSYACTAAASHCERGFLQRAGRREDCAEGCSYSPAQCYCSPDVTCVCGGGPPALCQAVG